MKKMRVLALALAAFVCMSAFAGCSNNQTQGSSNSSQSSGESSADASSDVLKIGFLGPLTGDAAQYGQAVQDGANLYIEEVNANGGVMGKQVELVSYDTKGDEVESLSAFNRLVSQDKVDAILGEVTSAPTLAVAQESAKMDDPIPMITASATADEVTSYGDNMFRSCFLDPFQGETMARYAKEVLNAKTAAIIFDNGLDYGVGLKESFEAKCKELGVEVVATESYSTGDVDFKAQLTNIQQKNPDVLFCPDYYGVVTMIVQQATAMVGMAF